MTIFKLIAATLFPACIAVIVYLANKKTSLSKLSYWQKQILIGIIFGGVAILATENGISLNDAVLNVRTSAPLTAGLIFGGPAGIIAGLIGGVERWFAVYWGVGTYTRVACTIATIMAGFIAAGFRKYMFDDKITSFTAGFSIGLATEVLHMLLVFVTNLSDIHKATVVVQEFAPYMISLNAIAVALALGTVKFISQENRGNEKRKQISQIFRSELLLCVAVAFLFTSAFTLILQLQITSENVSTTLEKGLEDAPKDLKENLESTLLTYSKWVADDTRIEQELDNTYVQKLSNLYFIPQIYIANEDGVIQYSNLEEMVGTTIPQSHILPLHTAEYIWQYDTAINDTNVPMMYTATSTNDGSFVLVGFDETFLKEQIEKRVQLVANNHRIGQDGYLILCDANGKIVSNGNGSVGDSILDIGIHLEGQKEYQTLRQSVSGTPSRLMYHTFTTIAGDYTVISLMSETEAVFGQNTSVYITAFMEILVFAILFVYLYFMTKRVVVDNIYKVNHSLSKITGGDLDEKVNVRDNEEFASLTDDINYTVDTLKHYIDEAESRIDQELKFAKEIQHSALPSVFPPFPNRKDFDIYALMDTAKEVGGDFYDFYLLSENRLGFLIADVSGKGIPAAMFMMNAKTAIKGLANSGMEVNDIFTQANAMLCESNDTGMFVTAWIGILDLNTGLLSFANAGHNPPLLRRKDGQFEYLRTRPNFVLAGMNGTRYKKQELQLNPGDEIFLYTDGVTEAKDTHADMFREERLIAQLNENPNEDVESRCQNVLKAVNQFVGEADQFDDITMLSVKLNTLQPKDNLVVKPSMDTIPAVQQFVNQKIEEAQLSKKLSAKVKICTDEIFTNIVSYSKATEAEVVCRYDESIFTLVFKDNGIAYDPTATKDPDTTLSLAERSIGGLGILMVKKSTKTMSYEYNEQNVLTLTFDIDQ